MLERKPSPLLHIAAVAPIAAAAAAAAAVVYRDLGACTYGSLIWRPLCYLCGFFH